MNPFIEKNKVFILGLLGAIALTLQEFIGQTTIKFSVIAFAVGLAVLSYLANEWRGQGLSITGILGNMAAAYITVYETGDFTWLQFMLQFIVAIIAAAVPDPKSVGYERTEVIKNAKRIGEQIVPAQLTKKVKL